MGQSVPKPAISVDSGAPSHLHPACDALSSSALPPLSESSSSYNYSSSIEIMAISQLSYPMVINSSSLMAGEVTYQSLAAHLANPLLPSQLDTPILPSHLAMPDFPSSQSDSASDVMASPPPIDWSIDLEKETSFKMRIMNIVLTHGKESEDDEEDDEEPINLPRLPRQESNDLD
jgi:hypothetical protein